MCYHQTCNWVVWTLSSHMSAQWNALINCRLYKYSPLGLLRSATEPSDKFNQVLLQASGIEAGQQTVNPVIVS